MWHQQPQQHASLRLPLFPSTLWRCAYRSRTDQMLLVALLNIMASLALPKPSHLKKVSFLFTMVLLQVFNVKLCSLASVLVFMFQFVLWLLENSSQVKTLHCQLRFLLQWQLVLLVSPSLTPLTSSRYACRASVQQTPQHLDFTTVLLTAIASLMLLQVSLVSGLVLSLTSWEIQ